MKDGVPSKTLEAIPRGKNSADEPSIEEGAQIVVTVQISQTLHRELFADVMRAKKRDRAERVRWLCQGGLIAERQFAPRGSIGTEDPSSTRHEFTSTAPRTDSRMSKPSFHSVPGRFESGEDDMPSVLSYPDITGLLL